MMKEITTLIKSKALFFSSMLIVLLCGCIYLLMFGKEASFISLDTYHPFWLNVFFVNYTFIGDGIFASCLIILYLFYFKKRKEGMALLYAFLVSGIIVQLIKNLVSEASPKLFFEPGQYLFLVDDVTRADFQSFPSGHTATAFAIATVLALMTKQSKWQLVVLGAAVMVGYSRIYLAQHFLLDVLASAVLGTLSAVAAVYLANSFKGISWNMKGLFKFIRKNEMPAAEMQPFLID